MIETAYNDHVACINLLMKLNSLIRQMSDNACIPHSEQHIVCHLIAYCCRSLVFLMSIRF